MNCAPFGAGKIPTASTSYEWTIVKDSAHLTGFRRVLATPRWIPRDLQVTAAEGGGKRAEHHTCTRWANDEDAQDGTVPDPRGRADPVHRRNGRGARAELDVREPCRREHGSGPCDQSAAVAAARDRGAGADRQERSRRAALPGPWPHRAQEQRRR